MLRHRIVRLLCLVVVSILLSACGGGGGGGGSGDSDNGQGSGGVYPRFAYVLHPEERTISIFSVDAGSGQLRSRGYAMTGASPSGIAIDPAARNAYVTYLWDGDGVHGGGVAHYSIGTDGALTWVSTHKFAQQSTPTAVAIDPAGKHVYVAMLNPGNGALAQFSIESDGKLTPIATGEVATPSDPSSISVDPSGKYAFARCQAGVAQFTIDADGGLVPMTPASTISGGGYGVGMTLDPAGKRAYVPAGGVIAQYSIGANGNLAALEPAVVLSGSGSVSVAVHPSGKFAYAANWGDRTVSQYSVGADGTLKLLTPAHVPVATYINDYQSGPQDVIVDPSGRYAYVVSFGDDTRYQSTISIYAIAQDSGQLTALGSVRDRGSRDTYRFNGVIAMTSGPAPVSYVPTNAYAANGATASVSQYAVSKSGALTPLSTPSVTSSGAPKAVTLHPNGKYAYVAEYASSNSVMLRGYSFASDGSLERPTSTGLANPNGSHPSALTIEPSGRYAYATVADRVYQLAVTTNGDLLPMNPAYFTLTTANNLTETPQRTHVNPSGEFLYALTTNGNAWVYRITSDDPPYCSYQFRYSLGGTPAGFAFHPSGFAAYATVSGKVAQFSVRIQDGALTPMATASVTAGTNPVGIAVHPSGKYVYVANRGSSDISQFEVGTDWSLTAMTPATVASGTGPVAITVDASGKFAYVANADNANITQYTIDADGALHPMSPDNVDAPNPIGMVIRTLVE